MALFELAVILFLILCHALHPLHLLIALDWELVYGWLVIVFAVAGHLSVAAGGE